MKSFLNALKCDFDTLIFEKYTPSNTLPPLGRFAPSPRTLLRLVVVSPPKKKKKNQKIKKSKNQKNGSTPLDADQ